MKAVDAIGNFEAYRDFMQQGTGRSILYLILITLILGIAILAGPILAVTGGVDQFITEFDNDAPEFILADGELWVDAPMPLVLYRDHASLGIVDTTGTIDESVLEGYSEGVFIGRTHLVHKRNIAETREIDFTSMEGLVITKDLVSQYLPYLKWIGAIIFVFGIGYFLIAKLLTALIFGLIAMLIARMQKKGLIYGEGLNAAAYALTPALLWQLMVHFVPITVPGATMIYYGIVVFYLWKALDVAKDGTGPNFMEPPVTPPPPGPIG